MNNSGGEKSPLEQEIGAPEIGVNDLHENEEQNADTDEENTDKTPETDEGEDL